MRIERFFANAELFRQIVHRHAAEPVTEEVRSRRLDDLLSAGVGLSISRPRSVGAFHVSFAK
jgi:hypothetical protein